MTLGLDYSIFSIIIILFLLPLYFYRKKVFTTFYKKRGIGQFLDDVKIYLKNNHPNINFNFSKINLSDKTINKKVHETLIIEDIVTQYINFKYEKKTQKNINKELLWSNYDAASIPKNRVIPKDFTQRKNLTLKRDHNKCNRCGKYIQNHNSTLTLVKDIKDGGTYHFENMLILCPDCNTVIKSENPNKLLNELHIFEELLKKSLS